MSTGLDELKRLNLNTEAGAARDVQEMRVFAEVLVSAHAPVNKDALRLNIGATEDDFREMSIREILSYVDMVRELPRLKQVNMHPAPKQWLDETQTGGRQGDYDRMIDAIRQIADYAAKWGLEIVLENNNAYWTGIDDDVPADQVSWSNRNQSFGSAPEEWIKICEDVALPNVSLCLDSSHVCTYAHTFADADRRAEVAMKFVSRPELIKHVHWNDNYLYDARGRNDSHALIGKGSLPVELHQAIKGLDATLLLEHFYTIEELEEELEYIDSL